MPEVVSGDPSDHTIEILWITSAACKTNTQLAATAETKCYTIHAYEDNGIKAKMIDLTNLIQTAGYEVTYPEKKGAKFLVGVCRPIQSTQYPQCNGSMACLIQADPSFELGDVSIPLQLASIDVAQSNLQIEADFPTVRFTGGQVSLCDSGRKVKVIYLCPSGNEVKKGLNIYTCMTYMYMYMLSTADFDLHVHFTVYVLYMFFLAGWQ